MKYPMIGVTGLAGSGKDTVANHLVAKHGYRREQWAFDLKRMVCETFGWDRDRIDDLDYKEEVPMVPAFAGGACNAGQGMVPQCPGPDGKGMTRRQVLIFWGTDCMRAIDPDIHVKLTLVRVSPVVRAFPGHPSSRFVFADVRFLNEAKAIREMGGSVIRTVKLGGPGTDAATAAHVSETEMAGIVPDFTLEAAHGEIPKLLEQVDDVLACDAKRF